MTTFPSLSLENMVRQAVTEAREYEFAYEGPIAGGGTATFRPLNQQRNTHIFQGIHLSDFRKAAETLGLALTDNSQRIVYRGILEPLSQSDGKPQKGIGDFDLTPPI